MTRKLLSVELINGQVPRKQVAREPVPVSVELKGGAELAKEIVDDQLRKVSQNLQSQKVLDPEHVRSIKEMTQVLEGLSKIEREQRREDKFNDKLRGLTEEQLDEIIAGSVKP